MRKTEKVLVPAREVERCVEFICDICKRRSAHPDSHAPWQDKDGDDNEVTIEMKIGSSYPEGAHFDATSFDVCPKCFVEKVVPALRALGAKPRTYEIEW